MELDDIKNILQKEAPTETLSEESFKKVKKWKSLHPAEKIKLKLLIELIGAAIMYIAYLLLLLISESELVFATRYTANAILFTATLYQTISYIKIAKLLRFTDNTTTFLIRFKKVIKQYIRRGTILVLIIVFPITIISFIEGFVHGAEIEYVELLPTLLDKPVAIIVMVAFTFVLSAISSATAYGIYMLVYNRHIKQINTLIKEFNE